MRLIALRGATTVDANEAEPILARHRGADGASCSSATGSTPDSTRQLHLHADAGPRRRVPGRRRPAAWASSRVPLLCAREIPVPGALPRVIRVLIHCYPPVGVEPAARLPRRGAASSGWTSKARNRLRRHGARVRQQGPAHPGLPGRGRLRARRARSRMLASNESPYPPVPEVIEAVTQGARRASTATRTRRTRRCAAGSADRHGVPATRIAIGNGSCDVLLAAGDALLEPGAELVYAWPSFSVYPHLAAASGARALEVPLDAEHRHDLEAMRAEITVATRLVIVCNPNNPTSTALPLDEIAAFVARRPAARLRDPRRGLRRVQRDAGPRRLARPAQQAPEPRAAADVLEDLRALRPARRLRARAAPTSSARRSTRSASRSSATPPRRPRRSRRSTTRTRSPAASSATSRSGSGSRTGCASWGSSPPTRRPTSSGSTSARTARSRTSSAGSPSAACSCAPAAALGREGALRVTVGTQAENERFLEALGALL